MRLVIEGEVVASSETHIGASARAAAIEVLNDLIDQLQAKCIGHDELQISLGFSTTTIVGEAFTA